MSRNDCALCGEPMDPGKAAYVTSIGWLCDDHLQDPEAAEEAAELGSFRPIDLPGMGWVED